MKRQLRGEQFIADVEVRSQFRSFSVLGVNEIFERSGKCIHLAGSSAITRTQKRSWSHRLVLFHVDITTIISTILIYIPQFVISPYIFMYLFTVMSVGNVNSSGCISDMKWRPRQMGFCLIHSPRLIVHFLPRDKSFLEFHPKSCREEKPKNSHSTRIEQNAKQI